MVQEGGALGSEEVVWVDPHHGIRARIAEPPGSPQPLPHGGTRREDEVPPPDTKSVGTLISASQHPDLRETHVCCYKPPTVYGAQTTAYGALSQRPKLATTVVNHHS